MKNITLSIDEHTHRQARIRAAELGTSVSALVRSYLQSLIAQPIEEPVANGQDTETPLERQQRLIRLLRRDSTPEAEEYPRFSLAKPSTTAMRFVDTNQKL